MTPTGEHPTRRPRGELLSVMRDLPILEESYLADNGTYSSDLNAIGLVVPESVTLRIELVEVNGEQIGLRAFAESKTIDYACRTSMGTPGASVAIPPDSALDASQSTYVCEWGEGA